MDLTISNTEFLANDKKGKKMRGSVYYQTAELTKAVFMEGLKKESRVDETSEFFGCVASFNTMDTYRSVWNNLGHYVREFWNIKDFEALESKHIEAYLDYKIEYYPTKQYLEKLTASIGKLEVALARYTKKKYGEARSYDFSKRQVILNKARKLNLIADNYHNRMYENPELLISELSRPEYQLAAKIQLYGGARSEGVTLIKREQLEGIMYDEIEDIDVGRIETKEKGGKVGKVLMSVETYNALEVHIAEHGMFHIKYRNYIDDIRAAAKRLGIDSEGSHGFRWNYAQRRLIAYQKAGHTYDEALQLVSYSMKHQRASITEHYL